jgi:hypothetical protein
VPPVLPQQKSSRKDPDSDREVFRSPGSIVLSWAWLVVAVIILIDLAVQGRDYDALVAAFAVITISALVYGCAWRPCIIADSTGVTVANPLRDHRVPWLAVTNVDVVNSVRVHCEPAPGSDTGKILYSWAMQASPSPAWRSGRSTPGRRAGCGRSSKRIRRSWTCPARPGSTWISRPRPGPWRNGR